MMTMFTVLLALFAPSTVLAEEGGTIQYANPYEAECRQELNLGETVLRPGPAKGQLRKCLRLKAANARRTDSNIRDKRKTVTEKQEAVHQKVLEREQERFEEALVPGKTTAQLLEQLCRDELGIGNQVLQPGIVKGKLIRCVRLKTANRKKEADVRRKRATVQRRQENLHEKILEKEIKKENTELMKRSDLKRERLRQKERFDPNVFKNIRDSARVRTDFSRKRTERSRTVRRNNAALCRGVPATEWAKCIREALQ